MALRSSAETAVPQAGRTVTLDPGLPRKAAAEFLGTALLVFFGCGVATVTFGFRAFGSSVAAGVLATALAFGLILAVLVAVIGPISGSHVNPAVTLGAFLTRRISIMAAVGYWVAQFAGAIVGALLLLWVMHASPFYIKSRIGLGTNGWGSSPASLLRVSGGGAFLIEVIITAAFVLIMLSATRKEANVAISGAVMGLGLALMNLVAIPVDGASVNPARSFGPALITAGQPIRQVWLFILAPLVGAVFAAGIYLLFHPMHAGAAGARSRLGQMRAASTVSQSAADEGMRPAATTAATTSGTPGSTATGTQPAPVSPGTSSRGASPGGTKPGANAGPEGERVYPASRPQPPQPPDTGDTQRLLAGSSAH